MRHNTPGSKAGATTLIHIIIFLHPENESNQNGETEERDTCGLSVKKSLLSLFQSVVAIYENYLIEKTLLGIAQLRDTNLVSLRDSACFQTKVLQQAPNPQNINF